jgi:IS1 family transposase
MLFLCHGWMASLSNVYSRWRPDYLPLGALNRRVSRRARIRKTYMTRVEGENTRLRHYLARLHRKTLCYSKSKEMLAHSVKLLIHDLKFLDVPVPAPANY